MRLRQELAETLYRQSTEWFQGRTCHPEPEQIERLISGIQFVLLPNYFQPAESSSLITCMDRLHALLSEQVHRATYKRCPHSAGTAQTRAHADAQADAVIEQLPALQQMMHEDVLETFHGDPAATGYDEIILTYPGVFALLVYRAAHILQDLNIPLLPRMMTEYAHQKTGIDIHPGAELGRSMMIDHGTGIVIGETTIVGDHVKIYQGVTLGALYFPRAEDGSMVRRTRRHPTVEDYVVLYSNATVLGGDTVVGHHSVIGSNAWVTGSVPPYAKVRYLAEPAVT